MITSNLRLISLMVIVYPSVSLAFEVSSGFSSYFSQSLINSAISDKDDFSHVSSSLQNIYSQSSSLPASLQYRNITCERATKDTPDQLVAFGSLEVSETTLQESSNLIREIDNVIYSMCLKMVSEAYPDHVRMMIAEERNKLISDVVGTYGSRLSSAKNEHDVLKAISITKDKILEHTGITIKK
ncbi:hypothetical protein [Nitrosomonas sp.]|uniref:hypothetical protein n=1 Tax=Nitrosomonas sp. TaxID=42353 RepID=UPI0032EB9AC3